MADRWGLGASPGFWKKGDDGDFVSRSKLGAGALVAKPPRLTSISRFRHDAAQFQQPAAPPEGVETR
jgi:hypothetical protein